MSPRNAKSPSIAQSMESLHLSNDAYRPKKFKIGLDYGTTYTAGTFCLVSNSTEHLISGEIYPFYGYASEINHSKKKVTELPSDICYEDDGNRKIGYDAIAWQYTANCVRRAKLGLDDRPETASARRSLNEDLERLTSSKLPIEVISDYLTELFRIFKEQLRQAGYDSRDHIELNCAVPSIWTHKARRNMVTAIGAASNASGLYFDPAIKLWPEAEAATEHVVNERPNLNLQTGDTFTVCDAGGGTVDSTTYIVQKPDPLFVKEVVEGSGALCGSATIDERFHEHIDGRVRACPFIMEKKTDFSLRKQFHYAVREFRTSIKPTFSGLGVPERSVPFSGLPEDSQNGFYEDELVIRSEELVPMFRGVADEIWAQVESQLSQARCKNHLVKYVIFTGGLSQSPFMRSYLERKLRAESQKLGRETEIKLIHASTADYSVAAGAIRCSLKSGESIETRRINNTSIGILHSEKYESRKPGHNVVGVEKVLDEADKQVYVRNVMSWMLKKGEEQPLEKSIDLFENIPADSTDSYPVGYYESLSQDCDILEEVNFAIDMTTIKSRLQPQAAKGRKKRRSKTVCHPGGAARRSARINGVSEAMCPKSAHFVRIDSDLKDVDNKTDISDIVSDGATSQEVTDASDNNDDKSELFFHIEYSFTMKFVGLLAIYELRCEDAQYSRTGTIRLPERYES